MIIIGEKINATRKSIAAAIAARDGAAILQVAQEQVQAGANYLDVNGGDPRPGAEVENMRWLIELIQSKLDTPLAIDSASPQVIETGLKLARSKPIVNSVSLEQERLEAFLPVLKAHSCMVVGLCMSNEGMPCGVADRVERAGRLIQAITGAGKQIEEIIIDPCFVPVSAQPEAGKQVCQAIAEIRRQWPKVHIGGGLSNVSFGLPGRKYVNLAMVSAAVFCGMDAALIDPCTPMMVPLVLASEVVNGADEWCANYVQAFRSGLFK